MSISWYRALAPVFAAVLAGCGAPPGPKYVVHSAGQEKRTLAEAQNAIIEQYLQKQVSPPTDRPLKAIRLVLPPYPERLWQAQVEGTVRVRFRIAEDGSAVDAAVVGKALPILAAITVDSVLKWQFEPITRGGKAASLPLEYEFIFKLE